jgi:maleylpyruvate isomerase
VSSDAEQRGRKNLDPDHSPGDAEMDDPGGAEDQAQDLRASVAAATSRLRESAARLDDRQAREPSKLPGWSRGHLLTHLARNADGLRNLLTWARTGVETPQYRAAAEREEAIAAGAGRPAAELLADLDASAAALDAEVARMPPAAWSAEVRGIRGPPHPAWYTLWRRLSEVEIHHVDLAVGYGPTDWPADFAVYCLRRGAGAFTGADSPAVLLRCSDVALEARIGPAAMEPAVTVSGPARPMLAWLLGRGDGTGLTADPPGPLPPLPPW